jgi:hypothetical protein
LNELIREAIAWYNLPLTVMLGLMVLYWLTVAVGIFDADAFNPEFDMDADVDVDMDIDVHADAGLSDHIAEMDLDTDADHDVDTHGYGGLGMVVLRFLNFGQVPAMVIVTVLALCLWMISMLANASLNPGDSFVIAGLLFAGNLFVSMILTKALTTPLKPVMRALNRDYDTHETIVGRTCVVRSLTVDEKGGQAEVEREGAPFLINVRVSEGSDPIKRGTAALVVHHDEERDIYVIRENLTKNKEEEK